MYHLTGMHMSLTCPLTKNSAIHPSPQSLLIQQLNRTPPVSFLNKQQIRPRDYFV